ncbi:MAG: cyclophilin-like family protein [Nitrososphaerota archaeon]
MPLRPSTQIRIQVEGGVELRGELNRYLAPMTYDRLVRALPLSGALALSGGLAYFQVEIRRGAEKEAKKVEPGDILYWPSIPAIAFVVEPTPPPVQAVRIGRLTSDPCGLKNLRQGARILVAEAENESISS